MGFFANLYIAEIEAIDGRVQTRTSVYGSEIGPRAYFSFGEGQRPPGLYSYANGAIVSDVELKLLPPYPLIEVESEDPDIRLFEAGFTPRDQQDPVMFHFVLPERFIPRRDREPFEQPRAPFVSRVGDRLCATYAVVGAANFRFHIERLEEGRTLDSYDPVKLFHPEGAKSTKVGIEFNFGILKFKLGDA
jgi:hypothetical protein